MWVVLLYLLVLGTLLPSLPIPGRLFDRRSRSSSFEPSVIIIVGWCCGNWIWLPQVWLCNKLTIITFLSDSFGIGIRPDPFLVAKGAGPPDYRVSGFLGASISPAPLCWTCVLGKPWAYTVIRFYKKAICGWAILSVTRHSDTKIEAILFDMRFS